MKTNNFINVKRAILALVAILTLNVFNVYADYVEVAQFQSSSVINDETSYSAYEDDDWYLSHGGGGTNNTCGWNKTSQAVKLDESFGVSGVSTDNCGFYIYSKSALANVEKITITNTKTTNNLSTTSAVYLLYSTNNGSSWSQISLNSGTGLNGQGEAADADPLDYTYTFTKINSARYAILFDGGTTTANSFRFDNVEITFYRSNSFTLTYDANGGSGNVPVDGSSPYASGSTVTVLGNVGTPSTLSRTNCTFGGWNTAADGSGTSYVAGNTFTISANTTLYAKWLATVTWVVNGTTVRTDANLVIPAAGKSVTPPSDPSPASYCGDKFVGWTATPDYEANTAPGDLFTGAKNVTGSATYYAVFAYYAN